MVKETGVIVLGFLKPLIIIAIIITFDLSWIFRWLSIPWRWTLRPG